MAFTCKFHKPFSSIYSKESGKCNSIGQLQAMANFPILFKVDGKTISKTPCSKQRSQISVIPSPITQFETEVDKSYEPET